jgi:uncharacterized protein (TIGR03083 family)
MDRRPLGLPPLLVAHRLRQVDQALLALLRSLEASDWDLPVIVPSWTVRDVAAHLLDTASRKLSLSRDACFVERPAIHSPGDLVAFVNRLNREGVAVYRRLSPALLIEWMELVCLQSAAFHESLDPFAPSLFPVSWAGEQTSLNWFDTARELTERWHHQQQIRLAVGRPGILVPELYHPVLNCFVRGLPHHLRNEPRPDGASLVLRITGDSGGEWTLLAHDSQWRLAPGAHPSPSARVIIPEEIAWRIFTKGISRQSALPLCTCEGDPRLCEAVLSLVAIVG